jgi:hypothetical protein
MDPQAQVVALLNAALLTATLVGLYIRRRDSLCRSFAAYLAVALVCNRLVSVWPQMFFAEWFWGLKESLYSAFKLAVAMELALLTFSQFPRARRLMLTWSVAVVALALLLQLAPHEMGVGYVAQLTVAMPRGQIGLLCLLATFVFLAFFYRVPIHPFHRGVLAGFALYLVASAVLWTLQRWLGADAYIYLAALDPAAYAASVGVWAWAAWRPVPEMSPELRRLQPWAVPSS